MIFAWLQAAPYRYVLPQRWRPWALLACTVTLAYQIFAPVGYDWNSNSLRVHGGVFQRSIVQLDDVEDVRLLQAPPAPVRRISGYAIGPRKRGTFELGELGTVSLFLDGNGAPYILVAGRGDARSIVLNASNAQASRELFERLRRDLAQRRKKR